MLTQSNPTANPDRVVHASAPGRVNLMGEHTDYNGGFVLPMALPQECWVALTPRRDRSVHLFSRQLGPARSYELGSEQRGGGWSDYVQGITQELLLRGQPIEGFDAHVHSDVPAGAGLASSAALELAVLRALRQAFSLSLDDVTLAQVAQRAETCLVGAPVGIMDQLVASVGQPGKVLLIDTETLHVRNIEMPTSLELVVIDSGVAHRHDVGDYRVRRAECEEAAQRLGVENLRAVGPEQRARLPELPSLLQRRVRHVLAENERVHDTVRALESDDHPRLRALFLASHVSQRDEFEVSVPEVDRLVALAYEEPSVVAARLTGGGFGGSVVMLARKEQGLAAARRIAVRYGEAFSARPQILLPMESRDGQQA